MLAVAGLAQAMGIETFLDSIPDVTRMQLQFWSVIKLIRVVPRIFLGISSFVLRVSTITGIFSYVQKHVIEALHGFSKFSANEVSKVRNIVFVIVFIFGFKSYNVVLLDASTANIGSNSLAATASIFTL